jgi:carotenoid cleavage oxygenase
VRWFEIEPCWMFHPLNAFDDGDRVVLDVVRYDRMFDANPLFPEEAPPLLWRWTIDTATGRVSEQQLSDIPIEYPRIDERVVGRRHAAGWGMVMGGHAASKGIGGRLARIEGPTGDVTSIDLGRGRIGGEWVMVPRGEGQEDGWIMSLVYDKASDRSDLVVLDAATPDAGAVATVHLPTRVPLGFHANWLPDA